MKYLLVLSAVVISLFACLSTSRAEELDKADKTEIKQLNILLKILVDKLAANRINELLSESESNRLSDHQSLLVNFHLNFFSRIENNTKKSVNEY